MKKIRISTLILILLSLFIGIAGAETPKKPEALKTEPAKTESAKKGEVAKKAHAECTACHVEKDSRDLKAGLNETCIQCHPARGRKDHVINVVPSVVPEGLPLAEGNKISCVTCHEPHGKNTVGRLLRKEFNTLCIACHKDI